MVIKILKKYNIIKNLVLRTGLVMIILFLLFTIKNTIIVALYGTLTIWGIIVLFYLFIIFYEEYLKPRTILKRLESGKYTFLLEKGFKLFDENVLKGNYKSYDIHVLLMTKVEKRKKNVQYDIIVSFYKIVDCENVEKKESNMNGYYRVGKFFFDKGIVSFIPKQYQNPDFKDILDDLIAILNREEVVPMTTEEIDERLSL